MMSTPDWSTLPGIQVRMTRQWRVLYDAVECRIFLRPLRDAEAALTDSGRALLDEWTTQHGEPT